MAGRVAQDPAGAGLRHGVQKTTGSEILTLDTWQQRRKIVIACVVLRLHAEAIPKAIYDPALSRQRSIQKVSGVELQTGWFERTSRTRPLAGSYTVAFSCSMPGRRTQYLLSRGTALIDLRAGSIAPGYRAAS